MFLLYGFPGSGKTRIARRLAIELQIPVIELDGYGLVEAPLDDNQKYSLFFPLLSELPDNSVVVGNNIGPELAEKLELTPIFLRLDPDLAKKSFMEREGIEPPDEWYDQNHYSVGDDLIIDLPEDFDDRFEAVKGLFSPSGIQVSKRYFYQGGESN